MKDTRAALRYAKAILNLAKDSKSESKVNDDMLLVVKTIAENKDLDVMLHSPIIKGENKRKPFSDEKLKNLLREKGYNIARRTVAKYREQLNIPVARLRKEL